MNRKLVAAITFGLVSLSACTLQEQRVFRAAITHHHAVTVTEPVVEQAIVSDGLAVDVAAAAPVPSCQENPTDPPSGASCWAHRHYTP